MISKTIGLLWSLVKLPIKLVKIPFKIYSAIVSIVMYLLLALVVGAGIYLFIL